jgi:hypothetical protein
MGIIIAWALLGWGVAFVLAALIVGIATAIQTLKAMPDQARADLAERAVRRDAREKLAAAHEKQLGAQPGANLAAPDASLLDLPSLGESLGKLVDSLAKAPAWYAMFIGGFALLALAASTAEEAASKGTSKSETRITKTTDTTRIVMVRPTPTPTPSSTPGQASAHN